jgi:hypothetical protein
MWGVITEGQSFGGSAVDVSFRQKKQANNGFARF